MTKIAVTNPEMKMANSRPAQEVSGTGTGRNAPGDVMAVRPRAQALSQRGNQPNLMAGTHHPP